ncbi:E3 SUMO-protein ligase KIAA1586-like [Labeo rohita]|uniref:E3 SUMO-protein ligase KIAA1586-like n=1 Tax=Labeo rohita TaxID=84645 RepID=A0A498M129_LABRO|nr:E3 SUMO-protein ligase KIAA1586-like [Labeo rohita]
MTLSSKRTRSESEDSLADTPSSQNDIAAGQTQANESCTSAAAADDGTFGDEDENDTISTDDNSRVSEHEWPECWSQAQVRYFSTNYKWLISRNQKLGCSVCSQVCARVDMQQGQRVSQEWSGCLISSFGRDKAAQQNSLRKKIKEHRDSIYHKKAVEIKEKATQNTMQKHTEDMRKADYASTCNVFRTAYKIGKHGRPFTDMPIDVQLQVLNGVKMGRVLHSNNSCANILDHIAAEMKKKVVNDIVMNERKLCVLIDESTTISGKSVLVVCLRSAISSENPDTIFFELIELQGTTAKDITEALLGCLHNNGFDPHYLQEHLLAFACDGASVMLGRKAGVAAQLCSKFPYLFVWHCSNHRLELAVCDVLKEVGGINHFKIFLDQLYSLYHASPKNQRELTESAHNVGQRLLVIGRVLSVRWVASSERTVKAVWENYQALQVHFTSAAADTSRDSRERAKYKGLNDVLTTVSFVVNLGIMYDALTELSDLSRMLQRRDMTLDQADRQLDRQIRVFESMVSTPGPYTQTAIEAKKEKIFRNVCLHENQRVIKINHGQFFRSLAENVKCRMTPTTSSHVSKTSSEKTDSHLLSDIKVLQSDSWPASLDIQYGDAAVRRLCQRFRVGERESVLGFREYKDLKASKTPAALKPLLTAVHTIAVSTSECERAFSSMNDTLTDKRNSLDIKRLSNLIFLKCNGPPLDQFNAQTYVQTWLALGRRSAASTNCEAQSERKVEPKTCWSLF